METENLLKCLPILKLHSEWSKNWEFFSIIKMYKKNTCCLRCWRKRLFIWRFLLYFQIIQNVFRRLVGFWIHFGSIRIPKFTLLITIIFWYNFKTKKSSSRYILITQLNSNNNIGFQSLQLTDTVNSFNVKHCKLINNLHNPIYLWFKKLWFIISMNLIYSINDIHNEITFIFYLLFFLTKSRRLQFGMLFRCLFRFGWKILFSVRKSTEIAWIFTPIV